MTDTTVKCFLAVCDTLNFTHAAEHMFMSQQAVSKQISALEKELGQQLFVRSYRSIRMTPAGEIYHKLFSRWQEDLKTTKDVVSRLEYESRKTIRIGYLPRIQLPEVMDELIFRFKQENPQISIDYSQIAGSDMLTLLKDNAVDFCICHSFLLETAPEILVHHLCRVNKQIAISTRHPLYTEPLDPNLFSEMTCIYAANEDKNEALEQEEMVRLFSAVGAVPRRMRQVKNHEVLELAVEMGEGIAICSDITALSQNENIRTLNTGHTSLLSVGWNRANRSPVVNKLVAAFQEIRL